MSTLITVQQTAELLNCKRSTIYAWAKAGIIPHYKIGQLVRFKQEEIGEWLKTFRQEAVGTEKRVNKSPKSPAAYEADEIVRKAIDESKGIKV